MSSGRYLISLLLAVVTLTGMPEHVAGQETEHSRPKIGLALSGGGARGGAHVGVIRELERLQIPVDYVAGTSMGAIIGGLYASGLSSDELEEVTRSIDWDGVFSDAPDRKYLSIRRKQDDALFVLNKKIGISNKRIVTPTGIIQGQKLDGLLRKITSFVADVSNFDNLPIPFRAVATDVVTGEAVIMGSGSLATAMRASMSVPGAFASVRREDKQLIDGGIANNLPIDVVREMGADIIIAVDISTPLMEEADLQGALAIVIQLTGFLTRRNTEAQLATLAGNDILIIPPLGKLSSADFKLIPEAITVGAAATREHETELAQFSLADDEYAAYSESHASGGDREQVIPEFVRIVNYSRLDDELFRRKIDVVLGQPLDIPVLHQDVEEIYGLDIFESVQYRVVKEDGQSGIELTVAEKAWGPNYLQFGFQFSTASSRTNNLGLSLGYTVTPFSESNAEWRSLIQLGSERVLFSEFYQPLGMGSSWFVLPQLFVRSRQINLVDQGEIISQVRSQQAGGSLALGRELASWGQIQVGLTRFTGDNKLLIGTVGPEDRDLDGGEAFGSFLIDTLDDFYFPKSGVRGNFKYVASRESLGADGDFEQVISELLLAKTLASYNTFLLSGLYSGTVDGIAPIDRTFQTGGLFEMPGFGVNELSGQHLALLRLGYQRQLTRIQAIDTYVGFTLQSGNVFNATDDISVDNFMMAGSAFLGFDTFAGPAWFGVGYAEEGSTAFYIQLGPIF
jgi:NTE family protein